MASRVTREEGDALPFDRAEDERVGGFAEWRFNAPFACFLEAGHGVESAAAEDANFRSRAFLLCTFRALRL